MSGADAMITRAEKDLGLGEPNYIQDWYESRNGSAYSYNFPWCNAAITRWAYDSENHPPVCYGSDYAYTVAHAQRAKNEGDWHYGAAGIRKGDVYFVDWNYGNAISVIDHVGVATRPLKNGYVYGIEGNTANRCLRRVRRQSLIVGYIRPRYSATSSGGARTEGEEDVPDFRWYATDGGQTIPPNEWTSVEWENTQEDGPGTYWSVVFGAENGTTYNLMAGVTLDGLPEGARVQLCAVHLAKEGGLDLPDGILKNGARGAKVRRVQEWLDDHGYDLGHWGADSKYGSKTEAAVWAFQEDAGIVVDGEYGPQTEEAMEHRSGTANWVTKHWFAPSTPGIADPSGAADVTYSIPERILKGKRVRIRIRHDSDKPARVASGNVYIHEWQ
ncbi:peptidoglycan-binding domain-containing protein [Streptomonospora litoralis]|uniref:Peptidoglycan binding domain protein n=1 Tax=Streptomonospora litoralis TaxID=2498135 RepID=A0A4P6QBF4_9ACTN|nr:peptidoglycan-binding domain-containing protein [Streptomonospora litoralis]QBI56767.1 Putative peptidoglycan binding domain protein [Streptomonospora litoralis]